MKTFIIFGATWSSFPKRLKFFSTITHNRADEDPASSSPRWAHRSRGGQTPPVRSGDRLKPLSPTRHHRSNDELRQPCGEDVVQSRQHLEKIDSHVTNLHTHVNVLTKEVGLGMSLHYEGKWRVTALPKAPATLMSNVLVFRNIYKNVSCISKDNAVSLHMYYRKCFGKPKHWHKCDRDYRGLCFPIENPCLYIILSSLWLLNTHFVRQFTELTDTNFTRI